MLGALVVSSAGFTIAPVIGILGVPYPSCITVPGQKLKLPTDNTTAYTSCFASFYVKWLEQAGARVVPIVQDAGDRGLVPQLFRNLNGILFTGGELDLTVDSAFRRTAAAFFTAAKSDGVGDWPIWGTCQGAQLLMVLAAGDTSVLTCDYDAENFAWPLAPTAAAASSALFTALDDLAPGTVGRLTSENITMNFHHCGVAPSAFAPGTALGDFFTVLTTNVDHVGKPFVSTIEASSHRPPVWGVQWHPERAAFEFSDAPGDSALPHSLHAVFSNDAVAHVFVDAARRNGHAYPTPAQRDAALIYHLNPVYQDDGSTQNYFY